MPEAYFTPWREGLERDCRTAATRSECRTACTCGARSIDSWSCSLAGGGSERQDRSQKRAGNQSEQADFERIQWADSGRAPACRASVGAGIHALSRISARTASRVLECGCRRRRGWSAPLGRRLKPATGACRARMEEDKVPGIPGDIWEENQSPAKDSPAVSCG